MNEFSTFGISDQLVSILKKQGIDKPTPIQKNALPLVLEGADIIAESQTGTGKTLAFLLPMFEKFDQNSSHIQGLIITPTRELAIQITDVANKLNEVYNFGILAAYGGQDIGRQLKKLKNNIHIVIATPGRLLDHLRRESLNFDKLKLFVIDEADQMLLMGFKPEVETILRLTNSQKQTLCFSATMDSKVKKMAYRFLNNPIEVKVEKKTVTIDAIQQWIVHTTDRNRLDALKRRLADDQAFMAIVFCRTKRRADNLEVSLTQAGYNCAKLHGDMTQAKRERVMKDFRNLKIQFLIATDVASRGLDISGVTHIYNYDMPETPEIYIHRIGRTGRAGDEGIATTFVSQKEEAALLELERIIKMNIPVKES